MLLRFLRYTTGLPAFCWDGTPQMFEEFEAAHCFSRHMQSLMTAKGLQKSVNLLRPGNIYEIEDILGIHVFFFLFQEQIVLVGPFVTTEWSGDDIVEKKRLADAGIAISHLLPYKLYYCSYCLLDHGDAIRLVSGAITALLPDVPPYTYQKFSGMLSQTVQETDLCDTFDFDGATCQFELEKNFFTLVSEGQTDAAMEVWNRLKKLPLAEQLLPYDLNRKIASLTGLRFVLRMVAEYVGVHPAIVFSISLSYGQKIYSACNCQVLDSIASAMIREFCNAIQSARSIHYSSAIREAVNYLNLHLSQKIDLKQLSAVAGCAPDRLSQRFKFETGSTVAQYLAEERCRIAANLLRRTDLSVQKISAHVGYLDNNYFVKVFKKYLDETPTEYRAKFRS